MQVFTNERLIRSQARVGRIAATSGLVILLIGMFVSFIPRWILVSFVALVSGLFLSTIGITVAHRWIKEPRADQLLVNGLKGLDDRHRLYHYLLPAEHLLLSPYGLFVLTVRRQEGEIRCQGERWHQAFRWRRFLGGLGEERLGNPTRENRRDVEMMQRWLDRLLPDMEVPMEGIIVFTHAGAKLTVVDSPIPVMSIKKLKSFLRGASKRDKKIPEELRMELGRALDGEVAESQGVRE